MSWLLDMTEGAFVQAARTGTARERMLHIVVVRLLAVAMMVTNWRQLRSRLAALPVPHQYLNWPMVETELDLRGCRQRLRFYVCPQAAILADDESFPVGTTLVIDRYRIESHGEPADEPLLSRSVMGKYAGVMTGRSDRAPYGAWGFATYGADGKSLVSDAMSCETVCLLSGTSWIVEAGGDPVARSQRD